MPGEELEQRNRRGGESQVRQDRVAEYQPAHEVGANLNAKAPCGADFCPGGCCPTAEASSAIALEKGGLMGLGAELAEDAQLDALGEERNAGTSYITETDPSGTLVNESIVERRELAGGNDIRQFGATVSPENKATSEANFPQNTSPERDPYTASPSQFGPTPGPQAGGAPLLVSSIGRAPHSGGGSEQRQDSARPTDNRQPQSERPTAERTVSDVKPASFVERPTASTTSTQAAVNQVTGTQSLTETRPALSSTTIEPAKVIATLEKVQTTLTRLENASHPGTPPAEALKAVEVLHRRAIHASATVPEMRAVADRVGTLSRALEGMSPQQAALLSSRVIQTNIPAIKQMIAHSAPVVATSTRATVVNNSAPHAASARVVAQSAAAVHRASATQARQQSATATRAVFSARPVERTAQVNLRNTGSSSATATTRATRSTGRSTGAVARGEQHVARLNKVANRSYAGRLGANVRGTTKSVSGGIRSTSKSSQPVSAFKARVAALRATLAQRFRRGEAVQVKRVARVRTGVDRKSALVKKTGVIKKGSLAKKLNAARKVKSTQVKSTKMRSTTSRRATTRRLKSDPSLKRSKSTKLSAKNIKNGKLAARRLERLRQRQESRRERVQSRRRPATARGIDAAQQQELIKIMNRAFKKLMRTGEEDLLGLLSPMEQRMMRNVLKKLDAAATVHELKKALRAERKRKAAKQKAAPSEGASETATATKKQGAGKAAAKSSKKEVGGGSQPSKSLDLNTGKVDDGNNKSAYEAALH